ncbi:MAG: DUF4012 domain-containing protein [Anaerolineae bacterium]
MSDIKNTLTVKRLVWGLLAAALLLVLLKGWQIGRPAYSLVRTFNRVQAVADNPGELDPAQIQPLVHQTRLDLAALQTALQPFNGLLRRLGGLPDVGGDVAAAPELLAFGAALAEAADSGMSALEPVLPMLADPAAGGGSDAILAAAVESLAQSKDDLARAQQNLNRAATYRANIDAGALSPSLATQLARFDAALPTLQLALQLAPLAPDLLGAGGPRTYLIVAQNNDEMRATGGFLTSVGTLTVERGNITALDFEDSYAVDDFDRAYPQAPAPLERYMLAYYWVFRDANWSPDFPTAAGAMLNLYHISRDTEIDGVIAVDMFALQQLVAALEPVTIPNWDEPATGDTIIDLIRRQWSPDESFKGWNKEWWLGRKNFVADLVTAVRRRVEDSPGSVDWAALGRAALTMLNRRYVQIWLADEPAQAVIEAQNWGGAILPAAGDYLLVVDSNVGFNKANAVVEASLEYEVALADDGGATARLTTRYRNNSAGDERCRHRPRSGIGGADYWEIINRCYWNYIRVYTPLHSELLKATPRPVARKFLVSRRDEPARVVDLPPEGDKSVWGTLLLVPRGKSRKVTFEYTLPPGALEQTAAGRRYHLTLQKQAGTVGHEGRVVVTLPPGSRVVRVSPPPADQKTTDGQTTLTFTLRLTVDREIEIVFE